MSRRRTIRHRVGWTRVTPPGQKLHALWRHDSTSLEVRHCGHPTALYPYFAIDPSDRATMIVTHNGHGFRDLLEAFEQVEAMLRGELVPVEVPSDRYGAVICLRRELPADAEVAGA